ncbi:MAG: hypothetical protein V1678_03385 [Candidatus Aenigmatarchaeota archaeon]
MLSEERKKQLIKELREFKLPYDRDAVKGEGRKASVDWKRVAEMKRTAREGTQSETIFYGTLDHLIDLKILSLMPRGNYQLSGDSIPINLRSHGLLPLYFARKRDAEAYKEAMFSRALYSVDIFKLS